MLNWWYPDVDERHHQLIFVELLNVKQLKQGLVQSGDDIVSIVAGVPVGEAVRTN